MLYLLTATVPMTESLRSGMARFVLVAGVFGSLASPGGALGGSVEVEVEVEVDHEGDRCGLVFQDRTRELGVQFRHESGAIGDRHLPETMGAGVAWIDYDGDGWSDLYFVQSGEFPSEPGVGTSDRLYRNLGPDREGFLHFEDVTERAGVNQVGYGQGVLAWDYDGDGDSDLALSRFGYEVLLENRGGVFVEVDLPRAPTRGAVPWGASLTAADVDHDGDLDLYVARYLDYDPDGEISCGGSASKTGSKERQVKGSANAEYCDPSLFKGQRDVLWRNSVVGDGAVPREVGDKQAPAFTLAASAAGLRLSERDVVGKGLGALFVDLNGDARPELYVANDITPNHLFINEGSVFRDDSLLSGTAVNAAGRSEAGMGLAVVDDDRDGDPDLLVTNFDVETNTLYRNQGDGFFEDHSSTSGFGLPSFNLLGFGILAQDFDLDGWEDVFIANGHIFEQPKRQNVQYRQKDLFLKGGPEGFAPTPCSVLEPAKVSRGAAKADFDLDGDVDVVVTHVNQPPSILETVVEASREWLGVHLDDGGGNSEGVGSVVTWRQARSSQGEEGSGVFDRRWVVAGGSYLSSSSRDLRFAVDEDSPKGFDALTVQFASGKTLVLEAPPRGRVLRIQAEEPSRWKP